MSKNCYVFDANGELYHWKYIKREKINGRYRYWYPGDKTASTVIKENVIKEDVIKEDIIKENVITENKITGGKTYEQILSEKKYSKLEDWLGVDERDRAALAAHKAKNAENSYDGYKNLGSNPAQAKWFNETKLSQLKQESIEAGKKALQAKKDFLKTPLGALSKVKNVVNKAKKWIGNLFTKIGKKLSR